MRTLHIIMPMAGEGSRFKEAGYNVPKPLIKLEGKELYRHSLESLDFNNYKKYADINIKHTFIVRKEFINDYNIDVEIKKYYPNANVLSVDKTTRGALETLMIAKELIEDDDYVVSIDCDFKFQCESYVRQIWERCLYDKISHVPMVMTFYSKNPIYSFVHPINDHYGDKLEEKNPSMYSCVYLINNHYGNHLEEKNPISSYAICGCYALGNGKNLKLASEQYIKDFEERKIKSNELYISGVYNYIMKIINVYVQIIDMNLRKDHLWSFGTPYDLENYNYDRNIWDK